LASGLVGSLHKAFVVPEHVGELHFLPLFYEDRSRYALHSRLEFLLVKARQLVSTEEAHDFAVLDRSLPELITFARALLAMGVMPQHDFDLYEGIYHLVVERIRPIDFVIWVRAAPDVMLARIKARGRHFEQDISRAYLEVIDAEYERWFATLPPERKLIVDTTSRSPKEAADMAATWLREVGQ
jgi:deoxyguanosine kinase